MTDIYCKNCNYWETLADLNIEDTDIFLKSRMMIGAESGPTESTM